MLALHTECEISCLFSVKGLDHSFNVWFSEKINIENNNSNLTQT